ncbi:CCR4-NOT transcription complex subunit 6-like isoform X2 [Symsagittifera roscoffensis]|uniref:CCR4-NOT transcription complex subunit 6-like isoform X2 n=1 Tax=Symsagittifera roscoffensis TaxID=84072 RepID=UPI00307C0C55
MTIMGKDDNGKTKNSGYTILSQEELAEGKTTEIVGLEITGMVRNLSPYLWTRSFCDITRLVVKSNQLTKVPSEITNLKRLTHLDLSHNMLRSLPPEIGDLVTLKELLLRHNYLRLLPYELGKLFNLQVLNLDENPMAPEVSQLYSDPRNVQKLLSFMLDKLPEPQRTAPQRQWKSLQEVDQSAVSYIFTIMTYNILAENYATRSQYGYCPSWALSWSYRKDLILKEIIRNQADIICLQEVVTDEYNQFFLPELSKEGYKGIFEAKSRARTMNEEDRRFVDGCAIFYKSDKFEVESRELIEFNMLARQIVETARQNGSTNKASDDVINRVMTKDNIGVVAVLKFKNPPDNINSASDELKSNYLNQIMISNVHIHWDPEYCDVKLMQILLFLTELRRKISDHIPLVLTGDFNSLPSSGVIQFLLDSRIPFSHPDFKEIDYKHFFDEISTSGDDSSKITHPHNLSSAYPLDKEGCFTNYTYDFKGIIDYIFYPQDYMKPLGILDTVDSQWFRDNKILGCPHPLVPSDHYLLLTELQMFLGNQPAPNTSPPNSSKNKNSITN